MDPRLAVSKVAQLGLLVITGFNLGRYSVEFSGGSTAWFALTANVVVLVLTLFMLIREFWISRR